MSIKTEEQIMIYFIATLILIVLAICMYFWHMNNVQELKAEMQIQKRLADRLCTYKKRNFTAIELSRVVNMKPLYIAE